MSEEKSHKAFSVFCRKTLRKTILVQSNKGNFAIITKRLDSETLRVEELRSYFKAESMENLVCLYLTRFTKSNVLKFNQ